MNNNGPGCFILAFFEKNCSQREEFVIDEK